MNTYTPVRQPEKKSSNVLAAWTSEASAIVLYNTGKFYLFDNVAPDRIEEVVNEHREPSGSLGKIVLRALGRKGEHIDDTVALKSIWGESNAGLHPADVREVEDSRALFGLPCKVLEAILGPSSLEGTRSFWSLENANNLYLHVYETHGSSERGEWRVAGDEDLIDALLGDYLEDR